MAERGLARAVASGGGVNALPRRRETRQEREHRYERELAAALHRRARAKAGSGYKFTIPAGARR